MTATEFYINKIYGGSGEASGTIQLSYTDNGTYTQDVKQYATAEIDVNVDSDLPPANGEDF